MFIGSVPPPLHGAAMCMQFVVDNQAQLPCEFLHLDTRYTASSQELGSLSVKKLWLWGKYLFQFAHALAFKKVDGVVVSMTAFFNPFVKDASFMWLAWLFGKPVIGWLHNDPAMMKGWSGWKQQFGAWTLSKLDRIVIIAEKLRSRSPDWWDQSKVQVLNNGVQLPESLSVAAPQPQGPWNDECSLTYLSSMDDAKGWRVLLEAAGLLAQKGLHPQINFYGPASVDPSSKVISTADEIKRTLDAANAAGIRAAWHGPVTGNAKWDALRAGQIFVFPSYSEREAFPLAVLEAMGAGLPIVATDVGGVSDALVDEQSNFVVPPQSAQALADAVAAMMADPTLRERLSQHNRARYESQFTVSQFMARWGELLIERLNH